MGISSANFNLITTVEELLGGWQGKRVLDLGNQLLRGGEGRRTSKDYFTALGATHVSFDLNGQDGAIPIDLCKPVPEEYWGTFDVVTNFGTSEHIANQEQVFQTIHNCCKMEGYMIHSIPPVGSWPGHCPYRYRKDFEDRLAEWGGYEILHSSEVPRLGTVLKNLLLKRTWRLQIGEFPSNSVEFSTSYRKNTDNLF